MVHTTKDWHSGFLFRFSVVLSRKHGEREMGNVNQVVYRVIVSESDIFPLWLPDNNLRNCKNGSAIVFNVAYIYIW